MAKWIAAEKVRAGLRHAVVCLNVTERTKARIAQSKCARRASSLANVDQPQVTRTCILRADAVLLFSGVTFVSFLFRSLPFAFIEAEALRSIVLLYACAPAATRSHLTTVVCVHFCFVFFCSLGGVAFSQYFCTNAVCSFHGEYLVRFPSGWCRFYLVTTSWILASAYVRIESINQK